MLFNELYGNVAVCLYAGLRKILCQLQVFVVPEHAVVGKGEGFSIGLPGKRVIILIAFLAALCGHTGVTHHDVYIARNMQMHFVGRQRPLIDPHSSGEVVSDAGRVGTPDFTFPGKRIQNPVLLFSCKPFIKVNQSK